MHDLSLTCDLPDEVRLNREMDPEPSYGKYLCRPPLRGVD